MALIVLGMVSVALAAKSPVTPSLEQTRAAPPAARPVTEILWGKTITDNYRYMEALDPLTLDWMTSQGNHTRAVLDRIGPRASLTDRIAQFSAGFNLLQSYVRLNGRTFYEEREPGSNDFDLAVSDDKGKRKLVDSQTLRAKDSGQPIAINYFMPSPDASKVAIGISKSGSEDAALSVVDALTGASLAGPIDRAQFGSPTWAEDSKSLYFDRLKEIQLDDPAKEYKDQSVVVWDLKSPPRAILGSQVHQGRPLIASTEIPTLSIVPESPMSALLSANGVQSELAVWLTPAAHVGNANAPWRQLTTREDQITNIDMRGTDIFLLSHKDAPTLKVLTVQADRPLSAAATLVPAQRDRIIEAIHAASDALYVLARPSNSGNLS